jgi:membrane-associated protein
MFGHELSQWIITFGYAGLVAIIFAGPGLFIGFVLPGDSVLFTAGLLASQKIFNMSVLVPSLIAAAFLGYQVGYWFGAKMGGWLIRRPDTWYFKQRYVADAHQFYEKHGAKALLLARLIPIVRTFVPIVAGMANMQKRSYFIYNLIGSIIWAGGVTVLGYYLGESIPNAQHYILPIVLFICVISILPGIVHWLRTRKTS